jgi:hypothetical protein
LQPGPTRAPFADVNAEFQARVAEGYDPQEVLAFFRARGWIQ